MSYIYKIFLFCISIVFPIQLVGANSQNNTLYFNENYNILKKDYPIFSRFKNQIDSVSVSEENNSVNVYFSKSFSKIPIRENLIEKIDSFVEYVVDSLYSGYSYSVYVDKVNIENFVPNFYKLGRKDIERNFRNNEETNHLIENCSKPFKITNGLNGKYIALWNSHGLYFNQAERKWQWQRPCLFTIREDSYTTGLMLQYLLPMLENAGAITFLARERDFNKREVIVDDGKSCLGSMFRQKNGVKYQWKTDSCGYKFQEYLYDDVNPFESGTSKFIRCRKKSNLYSEWIPDIPSDGDYAVYVSYISHPWSCPDARYVVYHDGDSTVVSVNQTKGGGSWVYIGKYYFKKGINEKNGKVVLYNYSGKRGKIVSADAVKFGGGMGNIVRCSAIDCEDSLKLVSGEPKYLEAARYNLQNSGFDFDIYGRNNGSNEYKDDLMSRPHWVNNLCGASSRLPDIVGKNIPMDLAFALHTDAGTNDSIVGTLGIYMTSGYKNYTCGQKRISSRDLTDIIQTQVTADINKLYGTGWTRRALIDDSYYEARVPEVPTMLLELLSHQNFNDMRIGLEPKFKFNVCRAIYKGMLKYLSSVYDFDYVVQPLPVKNFSISPKNYPDTVVHLRWSPVFDSLESTSNPQMYVVYKSVDNGGFDNGTVTDKNHIDFPVNKDHIYRFKVTAVNDGGESFPSEILSVGISSKQKGIALIVNGYEQLYAPDSFEDSISCGFRNERDTVDVGAPYIRDISYMGRQYDYNKSSVFKDNNAPGLGASYSDMDTLIIAGNTFDYPYIHGCSILKNGYSFVSSSISAFEDDIYELQNFSFIDVILGKQKNLKNEDIITDKTAELLSNYIDNGGNIFISGQYITDLAEDENCESKFKNFANDYLHFDAVDDTLFLKSGLMEYVQDTLNNNKLIHYQNMPSENIYHVMGPHGILPMNGSDVMYFMMDNGVKNPSCVYSQNHGKTIVSSVPFEIICKKEDRDAIMLNFMEFFSGK